MRPTPAAGAVAAAVLGVLTRLRTSRRGVIFAWLVAIALHLPALPGFRFFEGLFEEPDTLIGGEQEAVIPIELDLEDDLFGEEEPKPTPDGPTVIDVPDPVGEGPGITLDAGPPDAPPDALPLDAGPPDAPPDAPPPDAPPDAAPLAEDAGPPPLPDAGPDGGPAIPPSDAGPPRTPDADPIADASAAQALQKTPNITIVLVGKRLREHPIGVQMGPLLTSIRQWKSFFKGSAIDPVRDIDTMVVTAPELVRTSDRVVAVMSFPGDMAKPKAAVDDLVKRAKGTWIEGAPVPAAKAKVQGGERIFAIVEAKRQLYVLPADAEKNLGDVGKLARTPDDLPYALKLSMVHPHRPLSAIPGTPKLSTELTRFTLTATGMPDGSGEAMLVFEVKSREHLAAARQSIQDYYDYLLALDTGASLLGKGVGLPQVKFEIQERARVSGGKQATKYLVEGKALLSRKMLQRTLDLADENLIRGK